MNRTSIPWVMNPDGSQGYSWNPASGCNGPNGIPCPYCYARKMAHRFKRSFAPTCHPDRLGQPLKLRKPARIFVDSFGDLFDPSIPDEFIADVWTAMSSAAHHTYLILTKQAERMRDVVSRIRWCLADGIQHAVFDVGDEYALPNVWAGVTVTNQPDADERIPLLMETPAAVRFVSVEPLLAPIDLSRVNYSARLKGVVAKFDAFLRDKARVAAQATGLGETETRLWEESAVAVGDDAVMDVVNGLWFDGWDSGADGKKLDWLIIGNDSTPGATMPDPAWVESLIAQCRVAGVPAWIKGRLLDQFPVTMLPGDRWPEEVRR